MSTAVQCTSWNTGILVPFNTSVSSSDGRITFSTTTLTIADIGTYQLNLCCNFGQANADGSEARARVSFSTVGGAIIAEASDQVIVTDGLYCAGSATMSYLLTTTTTNSTYEFKAHSASGGTTTQFGELLETTQGFIKRIL